MRKKAGIFSIQSRKRKKNTSLPIVSTDRIMSFSMNKSSHQQSSIIIDPKTQLRHEFALSESEDSFRYQRITRCYCCFLGKKNGDGKLMSMTDKEKKRNSKHTRTSSYIHPQQEIRVNDRVFCYHRGSSDHKRLNSRAIWLDVD